MLVAPRFMKFQARQITIPVITVLLFLVTLNYLRAPISLSLGHLPQDDWNMGALVHYTDV
jgi:hypothetical protein